MEHTPKIGAICHIEFAFQSRKKNYLSLFRYFFTLWGNFKDYRYRGYPKKKSTARRLAPHPVPPQQKLREHPTESGCGTDGQSAEIYHEKGMSSRRMVNSRYFLGRLSKKSYLCGSRRMTICLKRCWRKKQISQTTAAMLSNPRHNVAHNTVHSAPFAPASPISKRPFGHPNI